MSTIDYTPLHGLPALAGVCSFADAQSQGLSVEDCVRRLKRYHYAFKRLHQIFLARLTAEPIYELKMAFSLHAYYCAEHVASLRQRVGEMREPPLGLDAVPDENLAIFFDEILAAPTTEELLAGIYGEAVRSLRQALERHQRDTNPLADHPTVRLCKFASLELAEMSAYGNGALTSMVDSEKQTKLRPWLEYLGATLEAAGGLDGINLPSAPMERRYSKEPFVYQKTPRRDARFSDPYNMGVNAEAFLYDPGLPPEP